MQFTRFAPAVSLILTFVFWLFPWVPDYSGLRISNSVFDEHSGSRDPLIITLDALVVVYPMSLIVGTISALASLPSRWRLLFVGVSALLPLVTLTGIYLALLSMDRQRFRELTVWFYLSHAATFVCVILCMREYKRSSSPS